MRGLFEGWRVVVHRIAAGSQIPVVWVGNSHLRLPIPTVHTAAFTPWCVGYTPYPISSHKKKKKTFFIRTFVFCNVPYGVSLRSNMGCYAIAYWSRVERIFLMAASRSCRYDTGTGDVWEIYRPSPLSARDLRPVMAQWWMVLVTEYTPIPGIRAI